VGFESGDGWKVEEAGVGGKGWGLELNVSGYKGERTRFRQQYTESFSTATALLGLVAPASVTN